MAGLLSNFRNTMILSVVLALIMIVAYAQVSPQGLNGIFWQAVFRWMHVVFGILWIGLLYYFNFVQIRKMPDIPAELKPAVSQVHRSRGAVLVPLGGAVHRPGRHRRRDPARPAPTPKRCSPSASPAADGPDDRGYTLMGIGMWLAIIMFLNVWGIIWPNQKIALGIKDGDADAKAKAARIAMLASRTNTLLSLPMLTSMAMYQTLFG